MGTCEVQYRRRKALLLNDPEICAANRALFRRFLEYEEYKLQRRNHLRALDEPCYKTLYGYLDRLRNVNLWFQNKPWAELTKADIKRVYDGLEDGSIRNKRGQPFADLQSYYNKVFRSKPFEMAGKTDLVREVMEFYIPRRKQEVRFLDEENFLKIVSVLKEPTQLLLCWLAWDIGENINSLLQLQKHDFTRRTDAATGEVEYLVNLPSEKLKRSRTARGEPTMYEQTAHFADIVLASLKDQETVFRFGHRQAHKFLRYAAVRSGAVTSPRKERVTWKDFRSGMACQMLKKGCSLEEVNARLGHRPSSREIDKYVTFLALDRRKPKRTMAQTNLREVEQKLEDMRQREKLARQQAEFRGQENERLRKELMQTQGEVADLRRLVETALQKIHPRNPHPRNIHPRN